MGTSVCFFFYLWYLQIFKNLPVGGVNSPYYSAILSIISVSAFLFGIYSSLSGHKLTRIFLGIIYLLYIFIFLSIGIMMLFLENKISEFFKNIFQNDPSLDSEKIKSFQKIFDCCGWEEFSYNCSIFITNCEKKFQKVYHSSKLIIPIICFSVSALLIIGSILVFYNVQNKKESEKSNFEPYFE
jgi:hypothetical protein